MKFVEPEVLLIGETKILGEHEEDKLQIYLDSIGASDWDTDAPSNSEMLIEVMGRLCYRSFKPGLNPNVVKIREGNEKYLKHLLEVGHGSVLEHSFFNFIFYNVSRVFTHELVRHRVGVAISQESLRFVRLTDLNFWVPSCFRQHEKSEKIMQIVVETIQYLENRQKELAEIFEIDDQQKFQEKKVLTSAMRRLAPDGLATSIGWSANARTIRHTIEMRTDPGAEEEIRLVFGKLGMIMKERYPNLFGDYEIEVVDGHPWFKTQHRKV